MAVENLVFYEVKAPIKDYEDAKATGRCAIYCTDIGGTTITCAVIYGWTGCRKGNAEAQTTDDLCAIVLM